MGDFKKMLKCITSDLKQNFEFQKYEQDMWDEFVKWEIPAAMKKLIGTYELPLVSEWTPDDFAEYMQVQQAKILLAFLFHIWKRLCILEQ